MRGLPTTLQRGYYPLGDGSEGLPALYAGRERGTGFWRNGAGRLAASVQSSRVWEITRNDLFVRSHDAGASISPLSLSRVVAPTADGQETRLDILEGATVVGRLASYRQAATKRGWKLFGYDSGGGGVQPAALTLTAEGDALVGRDLTAERHVRGERLGVRMAPSYALDIEGNAVGPTGDLIRMSNAAAGPLGLLMTNATTPGGAATSAFYVAFGARAAAGLGVQDEAAIFTSGASALGLLLGVRGVIRQRLDPTSLSWLSSAAVERMRLLDNGRLGLGVAAPATLLHAHGDATQHGAILSGPDGTSAPALLLMNNAVVASGTKFGYVALGTAPGQHLGGSGDLSIYTGGAGAGRLILGAGGAAYLWLAFGGAVTIGSSAMPNVRLGIYQSQDGSGGGLRVVSAQNLGWYYDFYSQGSRLLFQWASTAAGFAYDVATRGLVSLEGDNTGGLGVPGWRWSSVNATNAWIGLNGAGSHQLQLGIDDGAKPGTATWAVISDLRSKDHASIAPYRGGLAEILRLRPVYYRYTGRYGLPPEGYDGRPEAGFVAQEVEAVAPRMVRRHRRRIDPSDADSPSEEVLSTNYHELFLLLVNAVQELSGRLERLEGAA